MIEVTRRSNFSGTVRTLSLNVTQAQLDEWADGRSPKLIQQVFPQLSGAEREFILTGVTSEEWDSVMGSDE